VIVSTTRRRVELSCVAINTPLGTAEMAAHKLFSLLLLLLLSLHQIKSKKFGGLANIWGAVPQGGGCSLHPLVPPHRTGLDH